MTIAAPGPDAGPALPPVRRIEPARPLRWLALGWDDVFATPLPSLLHGLIVALGGCVILAVALHLWPLLPGAFSGFVLVSPILATGLYELSRLRTTGVPATTRDVVDAWRRGTRPLVWFGVVLALAATAWVLVSAGLFAAFVKHHIGGPEDFVRYAVTTQSGHVFLLWVVLGGLGSATVFAVTAISPPLLLEREIDLRSAILTSVRAVGDNAVPMGLWAVIIMIATAFSLATLMLGFVITIPVIGHATWHAYRDLVDADTLPLRRH